MTHVILDTSIWSRIYDQGARPQFEDLEQKAAWTLLVPPSTLLEALRTPKAEVRDGIATLIAAKRRMHPPTEAKVEAGELVSAIRRLRPNWCRRFPKTDRIPTLDNFWQRRVWQLARDNPAEAAKRLLASEARVDPAGSLQSALQSAKRNRKAVLEANYDMKGDNIRHLIADLEKAEPGMRLGWDGEPVEPWRVETAALFWREIVTVPGTANISGQDTTIADWTLPWIRREAVKEDRESWNRLLYREVSPADMPRSWVRCHVRYAQYGLKVSHGNAVDEQHASYLPDAQIFLTGDSRYAAIINDTRASSPVPLAKAIVIPATDKDIVGAIDRALA